MTLFMDDKNIREPLTIEEVDRLCNACSNFKEKLIIWVLLDTGMRVSEFHDLKAEKHHVVSKCYKDKKQEK